MRDGCYVVIMGVNMQWTWVHAFTKLVPYEYIPEIDEETQNYVVSTIQNSPTHNCERKIHFFLERGHNHVDDTCPVWHTLFIISRTPS